jgi:hypothetical protein
MPKLCIVDATYRTPSTLSKHWEDSYGNQKGKQEVVKEGIEQKEHKQKES